LRGEGCVGDHIGVGEMGEAHGELMASVNGGGGCCGIGLDCDLIWLWSWWLGCSGRVLG
jgi:hypothetical protein